MNRQLTAAVTSFTAENAENVYNRHLRFTKQTINPAAFIVLQVSFGTERLTYISALMTSPEADRHEGPVIPFRWVRDGGASYT